MIMDFTPAKITAIIVSIAFFLMILRLVVKKRLKEGDSLLWLAFSVLVIVLAVFEELLGFILGLTGTRSAEMTLLFFTAVFILLLVLKNTIESSKHTEQIKNLTQELALVSQENRELRKKIR